MSNLWERFKAFRMEVAAWRLISLITLLWVGALGAGSVAAQPYAYVTGMTLNAVSVLDTATNTFVANIIVGSSARGMALSPDGSFAYVAMAFSRSGNITVIDTATYMVVAQVFLPFRHGASDVALTPDGAFAYVTGDDRNVVVLDTTSRTIVASIRLDNPEKTITYTSGVAVSPDGAFAYVTGGSSLWVIDTATYAVVTRVEMDSRQDGKVAFTPDGAFAYVTSPFGNGNVSVIDTQSHTVVALIPTGLSTQSVAITPDGAFAYVTAFGGAEPGKILAIDTKSHSVVATIPMETQIPGGVAITSDGALAYVGHSRYPGSLAVIDTASNTVVDIVPTGGDELPFVAAITPQ